MTNDDDKPPLVPPPLPTTQTEIEAAMAWRPGCWQESHPAIQALQDVLRALAEAADDYKESGDHDRARFFEALDDELIKVFKRHMAEAAHRKLRRQLGFPTALRRCPFSRITAE